MILAAALEGLLDWGYAGLFIGAFASATVLPFSSDILLVGMLAAGANPYTAISVATVGNWLGGLTSYWVGWAGKWKWIERWTGVKRGKLERQKARVEKWGVWLSLLTWLPIVGDLLAVALGFYRVNFKTSALWMFVGRAARFIMWALLYYWIFPTR